MFDHIAKLKHKPYYLQFELKNKNELQLKSKQIPEIIKLDTNLSLPNGFIHKNIVYMFTNNELHIFQFMEFDDKYPLSVIDSKLIPLDQFFKCPNTMEQHEEMVEYVETTTQMIQMAEQSDNLEQVIYIIIGSVIAILFMSLLTIVIYNTKVSSKTYVNQALGSSSSSFHSPFKTEQRRKPKKIADRKIKSNS